MSVKLDHMIVPARDKRESATFLAEILGLPPPTPFGPFMSVQVTNHVVLDFSEYDQNMRPIHYGFSVSESEFDEIFGRIRERRLEYWADPYSRQPGQINTNDGGRGVYFRDPSGHSLEILTRPYGGRS